MANVSFYLKTTKDGSKTKSYRLYVDIIESRDERSRFPSPFKLMPSEWNSKKKEIKLSSPQFRIVDKYMADMRSSVHKHFLEHPDWTFDRVIAQYFAKKDNSQNQVLDAFDEFMRSNELVLSDSTQKRHRMLRSKLIHPTFAQYDLKYFDDLMRSYIEKGRVNEHINAILKMFKTFFNFAHTRGYAKENIFKKHKIGFGTNYNKEIIALTEDEIKALAALELQDDRDYIRNIFLLSCHTGARISDVIRIDFNQVTENHWEFEAYKTRKLKVPIKIPFVGWCADAKIYLDRIKKSKSPCTEQHINRTLKKICQQAGIDTVTKITRMSGKNQIITTEPKFNFISFHNGRRTFISMLVNRGVPAFVAMKLTGISSVKVMMKYANTDEDDVTRELKRML